MRPSHTLLVAFAVTLLSSSQALSTTETVTKSKNAIISGTSLKALRSLRGIQTDDDGIVHTHKTVDAEDDGEEDRGGGWLSKFRYKSEGAHGTENLNQVTVNRHYLQENQQLFDRMRVDADKRYETYSIWRSMMYHSDEIKRAMIDHGFTRKEYNAFVKEYKDFKPEDLRIQ